jgi:hypothetical protein
MSVTASPDPGPEKVSDDEPEFVYPQDSITMVWIRQGKTDHGAYILKEKGDRKFVKWAASERTQWIEAGEGEIQRELPKRRRGVRTDLKNTYVFEKSEVVSKPKKATEASPEKTAAAKKTAAKPSRPKAVASKSKAGSKRKNSNQSSAGSSRKRSRSSSGKKKDTTDPSLAEADVNSADDRKRGAATTKYPVGTKVVKVRIIFC